MTGRAWRVFAGILVAALLSGADARAGERDVFDRPFAPLVAGRARLVLYANRETPMSARVAATELALRLLPRAYVTVVRVDLRGIPGLFEGFARSSMRDAHAESVQRARARRQELGLPIPDDLADTLVFVPDSDGTSHAALGLARGFEEPMVTVEDAAGRELVRAPFPREAARVEAALRELLPVPAR